MTPTLETFTWSGKHAFRLSGSGLHEDTLKIKSNYASKEELLRLILPTLCITYADMAFQTAVGGEQEPFPASRAYGPVHFDPPIELNDPKSIERLTYIRGAERVVIGPKETEISFRSWQDLVIPRLRIARDKPADAILAVPETRIEPDVPMKISVLQFADGRHVGGVRVEKRHPSWKPKPDKGEYDVAIRVLDGEKRAPMQEARIEVWRWDSTLKAPSGTGGFAFSDDLWTAGDGWAQSSGRPAGALEAYILRVPDKRAVVRCFRALPGQRVRFHMRAWPLIRTKRRYLWKRTDRLEFISALADMSTEEFLRLNGISNPRMLRAGMRVLLPGYQAIYRMEPWDEFDEIGRKFGYLDDEGLATANGLRSPEDLDAGTDIALPDWTFFTAPKMTALTEIDAFFGLARGASVTVGRVHHPDPNVPFAGETIAVPNPAMARRMQRRRPRIGEKVK